MFGDAIYRQLYLHVYECHQHFADRAVDHVVCSPCRSYVTSNTERPSAGEKDVI